MLPAIHDKYLEFNEDTYIQTLRNRHNKELDMKEKDPKYKEMKREIERKRA